MSIIHDELNKLGIACDSFSVLQDKDGITISRITSDENSFVIKCFQKDEYKRELKNYQLLASLGIPTIRVIAATDSALLLEEAQPTVWVSRKICPIRRLLTKLQYGISSFIARDTVMFISMENPCMMKQTSSLSKTLPV